MTEETDSAPAAIEEYPWRGLRGQPQEVPSARLRSQPTRSARRRPRPEDAAAQARAVKLLHHHRPEGGCHRR